MGKKQADDDAKKAQQDRDRKQEESNKKKAAVEKAEEEKRAAVARTAAAVQRQKDNISGLNSQLDHLNGKRVSYSVTGTVSDRESAIKAGYKSGAPFKKAQGTNYAPGGMTLVGERGPELVNLPRGSQVSQAYRTRQALSGAGSGGDTNITISGNINIGTPEAANAFWNRIDKTQRLARMGMA